MDFRCRGPALQGKPLFLVTHPWASFSYWECGANTHLYSQSPDRMHFGSFSFIKTSLKCSVIRRTPREKEGCNIVTCRVEDYSQRKAWAKLLRKFRKREWSRGGWGRQSHCCLSIIHCFQGCGTSPYLYILHPCLSVEWGTHQSGMIGGGRQLLHLCQRKTRMIITKAQF